MVSNMRPSPASASACHGARFLIVEDEPVVSLYLQSKVEALGASVVGTARTGEAAVALAEAFKPDLVLMDVRLKGTMSGALAARMILEQLDIYSVFLTAFSDRDTIEECKLAQPLGYLIKPFDEHALNLTLELALNHDRKRRDRLENERTWRRVEARYRALMETTRDAVVSIDSSYRVVVFNPAAEAMFQYSKAEAIGSQLSRLIPAASAAAHDRHLQAFRSAEGYSQLIGVDRELFGLRKNGTVFPVEIAVSTSIEDGEWFGTAIVRDITLRKSLELQVNQNQKMDAVGRLSASAAHDFNNVLQALAGNHFLLAAGNAVDREALLEDCRNLIDHGASLTRQMLGLSRSEELAQPLSLTAQVRAAVSLAQGILGGRSIEVSSSVQDDLGTVNAVPGQFEQVMLNLFINARDAMPFGGSLSISAGAHASLSDYASIEVADTGEGMAKDVVERAFEPFFTTKPEGVGTGLGLASVKRIIEDAFQGSVSLVSSPGKGTRVILSLPTQPGDIEGPTSMRLYPHGTERVLVVEESRPVLDGLRRVLEVHGYVVSLARDLREAEAALTAQAIPQLVLCGPLLTCGGVTALCTLLRTEACSAPLVLMTGANLKESLPRRVPVLKKPFSVSRLLMLMRDCLEAEGGRRGCS
jgi:PAS domain S-box-containing protein